MPPLAELRRARGWTQQQLADRAGVSVRTIAHVESGQAQRLAPEDCDAIAAALGAHASNVFEFRPSLGLTAIDETGAGEAAPTGSPRSDS